MRLQILELQAKDHTAKKIGKHNLKDGWEEIEEVLHRKNLLYVLEIMRTKLISRDHDYLLAGHFEINKTKELIVQKYYWPFFWANVEAYVKTGNICLASKTIWHKPYSDL